jgi:hypothetical protein
MGVQNCCDESHVVRIVGQASIVNLLLAEVSAGLNENLTHIAQPIFGRCCNFETSNNDGGRWAAHCVVLLEPPQHVVRQLVMYLLVRPRHFEQLQKG